MQAKVQSYHEQGVYFKQCSHCTRVSLITTGEDNWTRISELMPKTLDLLYKHPRTTDAYCQEGKAIKEQELRDFILSQSKVFMWKDKEQPKYDGEVK